MTLPPASCSARSTSSQRCAFGGRRADIERVRGAHADDGQAALAAAERALMHDIALRFGQASRTGTCRKRCGDQRGAELAPVQGAPVARYDVMGRTVVSLITVTVTDELMDWTYGNLDR